MIEKYVEGLLTDLSRCFGFDVEKDQNFDSTPKRVAHAYHELLDGYKQNADEILKADFPAGDYDQMIICKEIEFYSLCSHHMLPFFGKVAVGYIPSPKSISVTAFVGEHLDGVTQKEEIVPGGGKVVGLSKLARIVQMFARRFQI